MSETKDATDCLIDALKQEVAELRKEVARLEQLLSGANDELHKTFSV